MDNQKSTPNVTSEKMNSSFGRTTNESQLKPNEDYSLHLEVFEFAVQGIAITSVSILGLFANSICLLVMSRPALKKGQCSSVNALLTSMAAVDMIVLICR